MNIFGRLNANRRLMRAVFYTLFIACLTTIVVFWWNANAGNLLMSGGREIAIGRLFGLLAAFCIIIEILLMSRVPMIEKNFDLHEVIDVHRLSGYGVLIGIAGHLGYLLFGYMATSHLSLLDQFINFNTSFDDVLWASLGTIVFIVAVGLSVRFARTRMNYELWYLVHLSMYLAIVATFLHQVKTGGDFIANPVFANFWYAMFIATFLIWLWYRVLRQLVMFGLHGFKIDSIVRESDNVYSVYVGGRNIQSMRFESGRFATWRILTPKLWFQGHPFSISSPAGNDKLRFTVKDLGNYSSKILELKPGTPVLFDGPRGGFGVDRAKDLSRVVLIAGGIGIAPFMSTIGAFLDQGKDVTLMYAIKTAGDYVFAKELEMLVNRGLKLQVFVSDTGKRIGENDLVRSAQIDTIVYVCGPSAMTKSFMTTLQQAGVPKNRIITERFSF